MSGEVNTLHFHEQDNIFRSILTGYGIYGRKK